MGCLEPPAERRPKAPWRCKHCLAHHTTKKARKLDAAGTVKKKYSKVWEKSRDVKNSRYVCVCIVYILFHTENSFL
jgi:histone acetyltransferase MYST4